MKNKLFGKIAIFALAVSSSLTISALAQTTEEGQGPSDQPSAPMEVGQDQQGGAPYADTNQSNAQANDAQPTEAQEGGPSGEEPAKTDQGAARVSLMHGDVSTQRGDSGDWSAAVLNQPVMTGDKVSTGDNARTELELDFANIIRLGPNTKANVASLTHKNIQIQLSEGVATYSVTKDSEAEPEIDTPNVSLHPAHHDGVFRIEVHPDGDTIVIVRQGEAQISTPQGSTEIRSGEMATVRGDASSAQYKISSAPDRDDWDRWNSDRDHMIRNAQSWHHTNRYYTGAQDLDAYGRWQNVPDYGDVWVPNESADWVPYRNGNWVYEPYYGWTWVGYEPWGWAPYHYGRWFQYGGSWAWWPGPVGGFYRPFWAPAYVSFWGWGGGFGFGVGFGGWGGFGWLPIGPCDWFHPWWGGYRGRFGVVNVYNVHNVYNRYGGFKPLHGGNRFSNINNLHNNHVFRAMSTVNAGHFGAGRINAVAATREQLGGARMMAGNLPVVPSHASLSASGRAAAPSTIRNGGSQRFYGSHTNTARPVSFEQQTSNLRQTMQQNHVGAIPAGGRTNGGFASRGGQNSMQRPSAGIIGNRDTGFGNRGNGNTSAPVGTSRPGMGSFNPPNNGSRAGENPRGTAAPIDRGGYRPFTPPSSSQRPTMPGNTTGPSRTESPRGTSQMAPQQNQGGFRPFTPPSSSQVSRGGATGSSPRAGNGSSGNYWNRTAPSSMSQRGSTSYGGGYSGSSARPQLDMRQPVVRGPSYGGSSRGGSSTPSYGGGSRNVPSYGGGSRSVPNYGGGSRSTPSYGGGGHSAPSYGGGGHSSPSGGGSSHPSGGGGGSSHPSSGGGGGHSSNGHR